MNTRGLMELVILNIGKDLGVISEAVFAMMILMALVTTAATQPILNLIYPVKLIVQQIATRRKRGLFSVLIPVAAPKSAAALARVAGAIMGKGADRGSIFALSLLRPVEHDAFVSAAGDTSTSENEALRLFNAQARTQELPVETVSFPSADIPHDIVATAGAKQADLVLMGFHKPVWGRALLGGTVHHVLSDCPCDVGVFVDRGFVSPAKVLVPYGGGGPHDRLALELASRIARNTSAAVTVLYVAPPSSTAAARIQSARDAVNQLFPSGQLAVEFKSVQEASPVAVVLREAAKFDLVIVGVSEEWGLESRLFGWRPERIARDCPTSLLIVRKDQAHAIAEATGEAVTIPPDRLATSEV
jgi:nucleotide-binding universal stress UspA family protein